MAPELRNKTYIMQKLRENNYKAERVENVKIRNTYFSMRFPIQITAKRTTREHRVSGQRRRVVEERLAAGLIGG